MKTGIKIVSAEYFGGYKIRFTFSDGKVNVFDYESVVMRNHEESVPYRDVEEFKKFKVIEGNHIAWGEDWDMLLSLHTIYSKKSISFETEIGVIDNAILCAT